MNNKKTLAYRRFCFNYLSEDSHMGINTIAHTIRQDIISLLKRGIVANVDIIFVLNGDQVKYKGEQ